MVIAVDCETALIAPGLLAPPLTCVSFATSEGRTALLDRRTGVDAVRTLLNSDCTIAGHNCAYDLAVIANECGDAMPEVFAAYEADRIEDTGLRQKLIDNAKGCLGKIIVVKDADGKARPYSLGNLSKRLLGATLDKTTYRLGYGPLRDVPIDQWPEGARAYATDDAIATLGVRQVQEAHRALLEDQYRQSRAAFAFHLVSCWGLLTDPVAVDALERGALAEYPQLCAELVAAGLKRPDRVLKSGKNKNQVKEGSRNMLAARARIVSVYAALGEPHPLTEKGHAALDEDACAKSGDPVLRKYARLTSVGKTLSTDVPLLRRGLVQPRYDSLLATGRTSTSPNTQNPKREGGVRECYVPRPGFVFAAADYAGLELRTWAQCCIKLLGCSRMAEVLNAGDDPHCMIAAAILGCSYEEAVRRKKAPDGDNARQCGKVANFGFPGGLGPDTLVHYAWLSYGVELTRTQAKALKDLWFRTWPEARLYLDAIARIVDSPNPIIEQYRSKRFRGGMSYCAAANTLFQGLGADAAKEATWLVSKACYVDRNSPLFGCRIVNFVHDEVIMESPEATAHEALAELERLMIAGASPWLPDVPPKVEGVLMRRWSKKAKRIEREGRVIPWAA